MDLTQTKPDLARVEGNQARWLNLETGLGPNPLKLTQWVVTVLHIELDSWTKMLDLVQTNKLNPLGDQDTKN